MIVLNSLAARRQALVTLSACASLSASCSTNSGGDAGPASAAAAEATGEVPQQILALFRGSQPDEIGFQLRADDDALRTFAGGERSDSNLRIAL